MSLRKNSILTPLEKGLFLFLFLSYAFFFDTLPGWNINTRMNLVYAVVDQHKLYVDAYWNTGPFKTKDLAIYGRHYYCDKSPILSFMGVPVYWIWRQITYLTDWVANPIMARYPVVVFTVSLLSTGMAILLYRFLGFLRQNPFDQLWLTLFYSLGTLAFPYSILFYSHQAVAVFLFTGFYILYKISRESSRMSTRSINVGLIIAGFLAGLAMVAENPAGIGFIGLTGYAYSQLKNKNIFQWFILGAIVSFLLIMPYNYACFGSPFSFGYEHEAYSVFDEKMTTNFMGISYPHFDAIWGITFSPYRGLFFYCPLLLFAIPGFYSLFKEKTFLKESILFLFIILCFFLFNFSYYAWNGDGRSVHA